jgi:hypothetical protein
MKRFEDEVSWRRQEREERIAREAAEKEERAEREAKEKEERLAQEDNEKADELISYKLRGKELQVQREMLEQQKTHDKWEREKQNAPAA